MMETTAITAITPMTIPNNVSSDRRRFARSEASATEMASRKFMLSRYDTPLTGSAEFFLEQSNLFFHRLLRRRRDGFDRRLGGARWLLWLSVFASRLFRLSPLCMRGWDGLWKTFGHCSRVGHGCRCRSFDFLSSWPARRLRHDRLH